MSLLKQMSKLSSEGSGKALRSDIDLYREQLIYTPNKLHIELTYLLYPGILSPCIMLFFVVCLTKNLLSTLLLYCLLLTIYISYNVG